MIMTLTYQTAHLRQQIVNLKEKYKIMHINLLLLCITTIKEKEEEEGGMDMIKMCSIYHQYECILSSLNLLLKKKEKYFSDVWVQFTPNHPLPTNTFTHPKENSRYVERSCLYCNHLWKKRFFSLIVQVYFIHMLMPYIGFYFDKLHIFYIYYRPTNSKRPTPPLMLNTTGTIPCYEICQSVPKDCSLCSTQLTR